MRSLLSLLLLHLTYFSLVHAQYGPNGKCGRQYDGLLCDPLKGGICCSINGFCGDTAEYCLRSSGCQFNCTESNVATPTTLSTTVATSTSTLTTSSPTSTAQPTGTLTESERVRIIVPSVLGLIAFIVIVACIVYYVKHKYKGTTPPKESQDIALQQLHGQGVNAADFRAGYLAGVAGLLPGQALGRSGPQLPALLPYGSGHRNGSRIYHG